MRYRPLRHNSEFGRVYARGKAYVDHALVLYVLKTRAKQTRVGLTATKKVGCAVRRNRARRVMKAAIDEHLDYNIGGYNLIFVARAATPGLKSWQVSRAVARLFRQAGLPDKALAPGAPPPASRPPRRSEEARPAPPEGQAGAPLTGCRNSAGTRCASPSGCTSGSSARALGATAALPPPAANTPSRPSRPTAASRACCWPPGGSPAATPWAAGATTRCPRPAAGPTPGGCSTRPAPGPNVDEGILH